MKGLKLSVKIIGGFGVILFLMILVMSIYQFSASKSSAGFNGLINGDVAIFGHAGETESFMLQARRNEKDFIIHRDLKYRDKHAKSIAGIIKNAEAISKLESAAGDTKMAGEAAEIIKLSKMYRKKFEGLVAAHKIAGLDHKTGLQGEFRAAAAVIGLAMPEHDIDNLLIAFLQIRRYEKDYLRAITDLAKRAEYKTKFSKALTAYTSLLNNSPCDPVAKIAQQQALLSYKAAAEPWLTTNDDVERNTYYQAMRSAASAIEKAIESVHVSGARALVLNIRKHEKDYLLRDDPQYVKKVYKAVETLRSTFQNAGILQEHVNATNEQLDLYLKAFSDLVEENIIIAESLASMRGTVHKIEPLIETIHEESTEETHASTNEIIEMSRSMSNIAIISGSITMLIGMALSFFLSRSITGPISKTVQWMTSGAEQVSAASSQVSSSSQVLAEGASEQAAAIEETSASMEEMSSMTRQNADNAAQANSLMREAIETIESTDQYMNEMSRSMDNISSASEETSKIIKTIDEIAFQTNLLALNAAVEAARAGEAGAGFAVVADEVRNLALRATEAAKNTANLIEGTIQQVNSGKDIVAKTTKGFKEVAANSSKVGSLVEEIATASQEQSQGFTQINQAITQMDSVTQQNSASAEESAAASEELNAQAESMMDEVIKLKNIVDGGVSSGISSVSRALPKNNMSYAIKATSLNAISPPAPKRTAAKPEGTIPMDDDDFEEF